VENKQNLIPVGMSQNPDSVQAGEEAAQIALEQLAPGETIGWALAFCGGRHDHAAVLQGLRSELGEVEIIGGAAIGTITGNVLGYGGYECAVAIFPGSLSKPTIVLGGNLSQGELEAGRQLGARLREVSGDNNTVLLFYDSLRGGPPPVLYVASCLMEGIYQGLAGKPLKLIGAGMIGDYNFEKSYIFDGCQGAKHAVVAVVLPGAFQSHTTIMHGCIPASAFREITRMDGAVVYELDGRPALTVLAEMLGQGPGTSVKDNLSLAVTLGQKHGDLYAPYDESVYVNRLIIGSNPAEGSITLFEADFQVGTIVQIMSRDNQLMINSVRQQTKRLLASMNQAKPVFALYIDCAGRSCAFSGAEVEEAGVLQAELGSNIPLLGFYSGVEVAPLLGQSRPLDWTGVLTLFTLE
jgi:hypothetical protein